MIRASEEKYRTYINNSPTGIFIVDVTGKYIEVNPSGCQLVGYAEEELRSMNIFEVVVPEYKNSMMQELQDLLQHEKYVGTEYWFVRKDGSKVLVSIDAVKLNENRVIGFCNDITDRMKAEQELKQFTEDLKEAYRTLAKARDEAETANRAKSEFLANMKS